MAGFRSIMHIAVLKQESHSGMKCVHYDQTKRTSAIPVNEDMNCKGSSVF